MEAVDGRWYYMKGYVKQTGWVEVDGAWYYLDTNGVLIHDTTMDIDGCPIPLTLMGLWRNRQDKKI